MGSPEVGVGLLSRQAKRLVKNEAFPGSPQARMRTQLSVIGNIEQGVQQAGVPQIDLWRLDHALAGVVEPGKNAPRISIETEENIESGTSGSPIVNEDGELLGVVSDAGGIDGMNREGMVPFPVFALPVWVYQEITAPDAHPLTYKEVLSNRFQERQKKQATR